jgi:ubiquinone/menaquinone biosynthesis C-methylase UbiE
VFVARREVGEAGRVIGVDFTPEMLKLANANRDKLGYTNVEFLQGEIEDLPVASDSVDVVISNCVLNLVPDKAKAFAEIRRVLKPGGHFCVSDVVLEGALPDKLRKAAELYVGCVAGALQKEDYLSIVRAAGFSDVRIATERETPIADEHLEAHLPPEEVAAYRATGARVISITVTAKKPAAKAPCCGPNCC